MKGRMSLNMLTDSAQHDVRADESSLSHYLGPLGLNDGVARAQQEELNCLKPAGYSLSCKDSEHTKAYHSEEP